MQKDLKRTLSPNLEDYLETIFLLEREKDSAKAKDIAERLGVQRASVTGALQVLSQKGLINYRPYSSVTLTTEDFKLASEIVYRHKVLKEFFSLFLKLPEDIAETNACRLEHYIDDQALDRIIAFIQFVNRCPRAGNKWLLKFLDSCYVIENNEKKCIKCIKDSLKSLNKNK